MAQTPAPKTLSVPLSRPARDLAGTFEMLEMREPTLADIREWLIAVPKTMDDFVVLAARLADVAPETLLRLPPRDGYRMVDVLAPFFGDPAASPGGMSPASAPGDTAGRPTSSTGSGSAN